MSQEIQHAFAHPIERARATAPDQPLDRISLRDHIVAVEIGAFQAERDMTQRLAFNVVVEVRHDSDDLADDVDRILSYDRVTEAIDDELAAERLDLLETLAERIAARILAEPQAERVFLRIEKLDRGAGKLGVEIVRSSDAASADAQGGDGPFPRVVFLSQDAVISPKLSGWIGQLVAMGAPLVFCVAPKDHSGTFADTASARLRIDLLSIEQLAWALASKDPRLAVVATKTELDWAMKNDQACIWAPSRTVLGWVNGPAKVDDSGSALVARFAQELNARDIVTIGMDDFDTGGIPLRSYSVAERELEPIA
ncbi:MAG: dihydroneopterin aldolase [Pseudomonadota bacterium]